MNRHFVKAWLAQAEVTDDPAGDFIKDLMGCAESA